MNYQIRPIRKEEIPILGDFLYEAIFIPEGVAAPPRSILDDENLQVYIRDFGQMPDDRCLVAEVGDKIVGAIWSRIMNDYGHVDEETPSFAISLIPEYRGRRIGTRLMKEMLLLLKVSGYKQASLAVQKANYAVRMYEKAGFTTVDENEEEYIMICELQRRKV